MASVACGTCHVRSYADGPQTTCEACVDRLARVMVAARSLLAALDMPAGMADTNPVDVVFALISRSEALRQALRQYDKSCADLTPAQSERQPK